MAVLSEILSRRLAALAIPVLLALGLGAQAAEREFELVIEEREVEVAPGLKFQVFAFNGQVPAPLIHVQEGDDLIVHVTNMTTLPHTIHWHGIYQRNINWRNDGVPGVTQKAIDPGETYTYRFQADKTGSLWYHCHVNVAEHVGLRGMWGPLVVEPKKKTRLERRVTREAIFMLSSWDSDYADRLGHGGGPRDRMNYFSINGRSHPINQPLRVKEGDVLRIRFYGAGSDLHSMHLHGHDMLVTHKDGTALASPYYADTVLVAPGERYDVIVEMNNPGIWMMHDHIDPHVTNDGQDNGGAMTVIEYEGIETPDWYEWKDIEYDPNFFYTESMRAGYGMHGHDGFKGEPIETRRERRRGNRR